MPETATGFKLAAGSNLAPFGDKADVAAMLGLCRRTIDSLCAAGMPHMAFGRRRCRFDLAEVRAWFKEKYGTRRHGRALRVEPSFSQEGQP